MKLVYNVHSEARYAEANFPLKLRPFEDELLSSWLIRLALKHRTMPSTFTNLYLPETKNKLWSADVDLQAGPDQLCTLSSKSGIPAEVLLGMTLKSYEGYLFERVCPKNRATPFVNPLGMRGRRNTLPGVRYCPYCLLEDEQPYFRKHWRLSVSLACLKHGCLLCDHCPHCGAPVTPYIACKKGELGTCHKCGKRAMDVAATIKASDDLLTVIVRLRKILADGYVLINGVPAYSHLYFSSLRHVMKMLMMTRYGPRLCEAVGVSFSEITPRKSFEQLSLRVQSILLVKASWLLDDWPGRFVDVCKRRRVLSSALLREFDPAPYWYWKVVYENLYRPARGLTDEEIRAAIDYMEREGMEMSEAALSRLLGVRQVFRKRKGKAEEFPDVKFTLEQRQELVRKAARVRWVNKDN